MLADAKDQFSIFTKIVSYVVYIMLRTLALRLQGYPEDTRVIHNHGAVMGRCCSSSGRPCKRSPQFSLRKIPLTITLSLWMSRMATWQQWWPRWLWKMVTHCPMHHMATSPAWRMQHNYIIWGCQLLMKGRVSMLCKPIVPPRFCPLRSLNCSYSEKNHWHRGCDSKGFVARSQR